MCKCDKSNPDKSCVKCRGGRPPLYNNCMDFQGMVFRYFEELNEDNPKVHRPYLITGLAQFLNMTTETLLDYGTKPQFSLIVKKAKDKIALNLQERSIIDPRAAVGCLFNLKCNHGMIEKKHVEVSGPGGGPIQNSINYVDPRDIKK